jgi:cellulose synthase operon protein YhjU
MGFWSAYFLLKLLLYALGYIDFHPWANLGFAVFTALTPRNARQRLSKNLIAVPIAILLLYHDSWLPPIKEALSQAQNLRAFSPAYLWELAARIVNWKLLLGLVLALAAYSLVRRKLRMSTFAFLGIFVVMVAPQGRLWLERQGAPAAVAGTTAGVEVGAADERDSSPEALDARLARFYADQSKVHVQFVRPQNDRGPYDILVLHVCSLSWDDLKTLRLSPDAFFGRFDLVLSNFSSGASYSGPAAIRLLRGACGATPERKLYDPAPSECLFMDGLQNAGFEAHWLMNHDGHFGNFFGDVRDRGMLRAPLEDNAGATQAQQSFDGTPIYGDYSTLSHWWTRRLRNPAPHIALYYNTISLHDGNRVMGGGKPDSSYAARYAQFQSDIAHFLDDLRASGRHVIVVFIAEHGAALGGDRRQIPGLREIPTAAIAHVPVAIALVNAVRTTPPSGRRIDSPVSYPALSELFTRFIADDPFDKSELDVNAYTDALPQTEFVAENNGTTVMQVGHRYMMRSPDGSWSSLDGIER